MVVSGAFLVESDCENTTVKKARNKDMVDFLFEESINILPKRPARTIGSKIKKKPTF